MTKEKTKSKFSLLKLNQILPLLTALIGIIGVLLPLIGYAYLEGYISIYGLNIEYLQRDFSEYWVYSYHISLIGAIKLLEIYVKIVLFIIIGLFLFYLSIWAIVKTIGKQKINNFTEKLKGEKNKDSNKGELLRLCESYFTDMQWIFGFMYLIAIVILIFVSLFIFPYKYGQEKGKEYISKYLEQGCENSGWSHCISINDVNTNIELYSGYKVTSSKKYIAIYDGKKTEVIPRLEHYKIIRQLNSESKTHKLEK